MKTELFIYSYLPDKFWLEYCLRSVKKFVSGFSGVTLVVPWSDLKEFLPFEGEATADGAKLWVKCYEPYPGRGHISHQAQKTLADVYAPHADFIAFIDSDSIFSAPCTPEVFFDGEKPIIYHRPFSEYAPGAPELHWKENVDRALHIDATSECMQHVCEVYHRSLFRSVRDRVEATNFIPFEQYVISQKADFPWNYCEFPTLGAWAMHNHKDEYHFIDLSKEKPREMIVKQYWSHTLHRPDFAEEHKKTIAEIEAILQ